MVSIRDIPDTDSVVPASGCKLAAVRRECERQNMDMGREPSRAGCLVMDGPEEDSTFVTPSGNPLAIRGDCKGSDMSVGGI